MANSGSGELDFFALSFNDQMAVTAQALYGYGYSAPFSEFLERPVSCEFEDLKKVRFAFGSNLYHVFFN